MAFTHSLSTINVLFHTPRVPLNRFPILPLNFPKILLCPPFCLPQKLTAAEQERILEAVAKSDEEILPGVRIYEENSARLTLVGAVDSQQALTAAAADGGRAADEHILAGLETMVVETISPESPDENSTLSTRLFLPARKVKEKVKNLKGLVDEDIISSTTLENILGMTFRQVVLQQLWRFELVSFRPGSGRYMDDLEKPREVTAIFTITSSEEQAIAVLAEVICCSALESVEKQFYGDSSNRASSKFFGWFHKPKRIVSKDSSVILHKLLEIEIVANAKTLLESFSSERIRSLGIKSNNCWWMLPSYAQLEKIGGPEFTSWISEHIPLYRLQIDVGKLKDVKLEGGKFSTTNIWEVLLTHSQMVSLANILDLYYEDDFTLPNKQLSSGGVMKPFNISKNESSSSLFRMLSATLVGGLFLVTVSILSQFHLPSLPRWRKFLSRDHLIQSSCVRCIQPQSLEAVKFEDYCTLVIRKVKDSFGWPGEIVTEAGSYTWTGDLPLYLKRMVEIGSMTLDISSSCTLLGERFEYVKGSLQDIASYQVVLSCEGKIVGFEPTNRVAVNYWASNPLAKELYAGRNLAPGFIEPGLKIPQPSDVVVLELLMSANSDPHFSLVRPVDTSGMINRNLSI